MNAIEKRNVLLKYCKNGDCSKCVLRDRNWKTERHNGCNCLKIESATMAEIEIAYDILADSAAALENGGNDMETPTITISLERYDELIKKEVLYDELTKNKGINMYLFQEVNERLREDK